MSKKKLTLKEARDKGKLKQFIKEHEKDAPGDAERFERALTSMVGKSKATPATSKREPSDD